MEEINLKEFFTFYKKFILGVIAVCLVFVVITLLFNIFIKKPLYSTSTTLILVNNENDTSQTISQNDILLNQKLVSSYSRIVKSRLVLEQVIDNLNLEYDFEDLYGEVEVASVNDTEIFEIKVTDKNADLAYKIASEITTVFDKEIKQIYKISNVSIIDGATLPTKPSNDHLFRDIVIAFFIGFILSSGIVFIVFYFDDTVRDIETIEKEINLPIIAKIYKDNSGIDLIVDKKPNSNASESIRTLRTNLQFSSIDEDLKTILVTSSLPSEGKSFVSANLAISFAQTGLRVLLMDCDLRKGRQSNVFKINGRKGLSNLLIHDIHKYADYIFETKIDNLYIIPKGAVPPNPSELLNSKKNEALLELLKKYFDIIILDGAPIMGLSDSLILSSLVDKTIIVTSINHTPKSELINTKKGLESVGADVAGVVANNITAPKGHYGGYYYSGYASESTEPIIEEPKKRVRRVKPISAIKFKEETPEEEKTEEDNSTLIDDTIENLLKRK